MIQIYLAMHCFAYKLVFKINKLLLMKMAKFLCMLIYCGSI